MAEREERRQVGRHAPEFRADCSEIAFVLPLVHTIIDFGAN